jgi:hypothetical protein
MALWITVAQVQKKGVAGHDDAFVRLPDRASAGLVDEHAPADTASVSHTRLDPVTANHRAVAKAPSRHANLTTLRNPE